MGVAIQGAAISRYSDQFGKKRNGKPRRMLLPEGVSLLPVDGKFELCVNQASVGLFDSPSAAIEHLVQTGTIVPEAPHPRKERPEPKHSYEYHPGPKGGINLYCDEEFEGFFPDMAAARKYVWELARERQREALRKAGNYWD